jgi:hypothetical protein
MLTGQNRSPKAPQTGQNPLAKIRKTTPDPAQFCDSLHTPI